MSLLAEVFDTVVEPSDKSYNTKGYGDYLKVLDWKLRKFDRAGSGRKSLAYMSSSNLDEVIDLYRLGTLVYLRRASGGILQIDERFMGWIDQGFALLARLPACQWLFPLLIFGCEAGTDEQRMIILDLISRTKDSSQVPNLKVVEQTIRTIWVQGDLLTEDLKYVSKLGIVLSTTYAAVPAFI